MTKLDINKNHQEGQDMFGVDESFLSYETDLLSTHTFLESIALQNQIKEEPGKFYYKRESSDKKYSVYSYTIRLRGTPIDIKRKAKEQLNLNSIDGVLVVNRGGHEYDSSAHFQQGDKIYIKVPKIESVNDKTESMKCKGGEYFGIDISKFNEEINLKKFKERNRKKWDSEKPDTRGVSFVYIRASDGVTPDNKVEKHVNKIREYNNDKTIIANHEKIAVGFYHRLNGGDAKENAKIFLNVYNKHKDTSNGHNLVPMLDLEGNWIKNNKKTDVRKKAITRLETIEKETGITPGIYVTSSIYRDYIGNDTRFDKYLSWIAAYPGSNRTSGRESGTARRINHRDGTVNIGSEQNPKLVSPNVYQSSQEGTVDGAYAKITDGKGKKRKTYYDTDMDHTKDITKLFSENNKSK